MKKILLPLLLLAISFVLPSCNKKNEPTSPSDVLQFIYDGMSTYYLWSEDMLDKKPVATQEPEVYFKSVLSQLDKEHHWSFVTDDVEALLGNFSGDPVSFGFDLTFAFANKGETEYFAILRYVFPNTPAAKAGLKRLDFIGKIDGQPITEQNYRKLFGNSAVKLKVYQYTAKGLTAGREVSITPRKIVTDPVLLDTIYTDQASGKKIGYLFYTGFIHDYNKSLYDAFEKFKSQGVSDLVVDLRYNPGGRTSAASYLASLIAPESVVKEKAAFIKFSYNDFLNKTFDKNKWSRTDHLGDYSEEFPNPLDANLNLNKVYIIATKDSYSASELTTFCLKDYMEVVHIGGKTGGKFTASWTIHAYDEKVGIPIYESSKLDDKKKAKLKNWAMQPIVAFYANSKGENFSNPGYLKPQFSLKEGDGEIANWTQIGDTRDTYLSKALYEITGNSTYLLKAPAQRMKRIKGLNSLEETHLDNPMDGRNNSLIMDQLPVENQRELIELLKVCQK